MNRILTGLLSLGIGLAAISAGWYWQMQAPQNAPTARFTTINGQNLDLAALQGKPVIVTFWASDCPSCLEEIPHWISLHQQFAERGLNIIAVAMAYDPPNRVIELAQAQHLPYAIALDPDGHLAEAFDVQLTPSSFLIDPQGRIAIRQLGLFDIQVWQQTIQSWLDSPA